MTEGRNTQYVAPWALFNRHAETIFPSAARRVRFQHPQRERIATPDDDFLDLDWYRQDSSKCVIVSHGLEGNSRRPYVMGMARAFFLAGFDVLAWNYRGCSGEINRQLRFYHSGATDDLDVVVRHAARSYQDLHLVGFSLGGNITLKYLGEVGTGSVVRKGVAISVPLNLHSSCIEISKPGNWIYSRRFLRKLKEKVTLKAAIRADLKLGHLHKLNTLMDFDDQFTGPIHGFDGAIDYYTKCSSLYFLDKIRTPTLLINAKNDPFLGSDCFPAGLNQQFLHVEYPARGGHVGFALFGSKGIYWTEMKAVSFMTEG